MSKAKDFINLLEIGRPKDTRGVSLGGQDEYVLKDKRSKKYVGLGGFHQTLVDKEDDAKVFTGHALMDIGYDWQSRYDAVLLEGISEKDATFSGTKIDKSHPMYTRGKYDAIQFGYIPDFKTEDEKIHWVAGYADQKTKDKNKGKENDQS